MRSSSERQLESLENQYSEILRAALIVCAQGRWGLFGQKGARADQQPTAVNELFDLGGKIDDLRRKLGYADFPMHRTLVRLRHQRDANTLGEPKLAQQWLDEIDCSRGESANQAEVNLVASVAKDKIPKGFSQSLRSSVLMEALRHARIEFHTHLILTNNQRRFFVAEFWPANPNVAYERLYIQSGMVVAKDARSARAFMEENVVPRFVSWVQDIARRPANSPVRRERQLFGSAFSPLVDSQAEEEI